MAFRRRHNGMVEEPGIFASQNHDETFVMSCRSTAAGGSFDNCIDGFGASLKAANAFLTVAVSRSMFFASRDDSS